MVHFLDAVIKLVKFFGVFSQRKQTNRKKNLQKPGGRRICQKHRMGYNRSPTSVGAFDVNGAAHVASRILAAILPASKNGGFDRVLLGSSLQKLDYQ